MIAWDPDALLQGGMPRAIAFPGTDLIVTWTVQPPGAPLVDACMTQERDRDGLLVFAGWRAGGIAICPLRKAGMMGRALVLGLRGRETPSLPQTGPFAWLFRPRAD